MLDRHRKLAHRAHALFNVFGAQDRFAHFHALVEEDLVGFGDVVGGGHGGWWDGCVWWFKGCLKGV